VRALLLLSLFDRMPQSYQRAFQSTWHYSVWVPITQWFPYVFCSFCLVDQMKFKSGARRKESTHSNNVELNPSPNPATDGRTFSVDSTTSGVSTGLSSTDGPSRSLAYLVSQLGESADTESSYTGTNYFDTPSSPERSPVRTTSRGTGTSPTGIHESSYCGGERKEDSGVDHFFTTSALHSRSNSTAQP